MPLWISIAALLLTLTCSLLAAQLPDPENPLPYTLED